MSCANQPSTRFSHDELVGVKCRCHRSRRGCASHSATGGALCAERLSNTTCTSRSARHVQVDPFEERQHIVGRVLLAGLVQDLTGPDVQRGEQIDGAVAFVVMGHGLRPPGFERQRRLGAIQRLALGLLVEAEHRRSFRRIEIQADDINEFLLEARIVRQLERLDPPRPQVPGPPDPSHGVLAHTVTLTHRARRPCGRFVVRNRVQRVLHDRVDHRLWNLGLATPSRRDRPDRVDTTRFELRPPPSHRVRGRRRTPERSDCSRHRRAASNRPRACTTIRCGNVDERAMLSSSPRCLRVTFNGAATITGMLPP